MEEQLREVQKIRVVELSFLSSGTAYVTNVIISLCVKHGGLGELAVSCVSDMNVSKRFF